MITGPVVLVHYAAICLYWTREAFSTVVGRSAAELARERALGRRRDRLERVFRLYPDFTPRPEGVSGVGAMEDA